MGLGQSHRAASNEERAVLEFRAAQSGFERAGAVALAAEAAQACSETGHGASTANKRPPQQPATASPGLEDNVFRRDGEYWALAFEAKTVLLRDQKGLHYLGRLLAHPGRDFHVLDLVAGDAGNAAGGVDELETGLSVSLGMDAGVLLDAKAKAAYRRRLLEIEEDCDDALARGDHERAAQAESERDFLVRELARAVGLGGRDRRAASTSERARQRHAGGAPCHGPHRRAPSRAGCAPAAHRAYRHELRVRARSTCADHVAGVTISSGRRSFHSVISAGLARCHATPPGVASRCSVTGCGS